MTTIEELEGLFDDHPSVNASLEDFEPGSSEIDQPPRFGYPSRRSASRSDTDSEAPPPSSSAGRYSPPAWRRDGDGNRNSGFWNGPASRRLRGGSLEYESAEEGEDPTLAAAARTRLPTGSLSPEKQGSPSPDPFPAGAGDFGDTFGEVKREDAKEVVAPSPENPNNCMFPCLSMWCMLIMAKISDLRSEPKSNIERSHSKLCTTS